MWSLAADPANAVPRPIGIWLNRLSDLFFSWARRENQRAGDVIRHMRLLLGRGTPEIMPLDLNQLVGDVLRLVRSEIKHRGTSVEIQLTPDLGNVPGDRVPLQQVLINLLLNASEAMQHLPPGNRRILVRTHEQRGVDATISVRDRGSGLAPEVLADALLPFYSTKPKGTGLGLTLCREIVDAHGGRLSIANRDGGGAVVTVWVPAAPAAA